MHFFLLFTPKKNQRNDLFLPWKRGQKSIVSWKTDSHHCSMQRLWLDVFHACIDKQFTSENFWEKRKINIQQFKFIFLSALFPAWLVPSTLPVWSSLFFLSANQKNWINPFSHRSLFGDHTAEKEPKWPQTRDWLISEIVSGINDLPAVRRRHRARHEHYCTPYMLRIQCIGCIEEFFGNFLMAVSFAFASFIFIMVTKSINLPL